MMAILLPPPLRSSRRNKRGINGSLAMPVKEKKSGKQRQLKASISRPLPVVLESNERPESETSSASGTTFSSIASSEKGPDSFIPCGVCRKQFDAQNPQALFAHLGGHFDTRHSFNRCDECQINFVTESDLRQHLKSVSEHKTCGFMFQHQQPCTGHHPPRRRELKDDSRFDFCYRLQRWEGTQLEANRKPLEDAMLQAPTPAPAVSTRTFSISSMSDIMRLSRMSRCSKADFVERPLVERAATSPSDALGAALLRAICSANVDLVASFLDVGANIHVVDALGFGVMHYNAQYGSPEIGWLLVSAGADPNGSDRRGTSPLAHAITARNTELVRYFMAWGAQPDVREMKAVVNSGNAENIEFMLEWWEQQEKPREVLDLLLIQAVRKQNRDMVEMLLDHGARPTATDESGKTALLLAGDAQNRPIILLLLERGADHGQKSLTEMKSVRNFATAEMLCAKVS